MTSWARSIECPNVSILSPLTRDTVPKQGSRGACTTAHWRTVICRSNSPILACIIECLALKAAPRRGGSPMLSLRCLGVLPGRPVVRVRLRMMQDLVLKISRFHHRDNVRFVLVRSIVPALGIFTASTCIPILKQDQAT